MIHLPKVPAVVGTGRHGGMNDGTIKREAGGASSTWMPAMPSRMTTSMAGCVQPAHETTHARSYMRDAAEAAAPISYIAITAKRRKELDGRFEAREKRDAAVAPLSRLHL